MYIYFFEREHIKVQRNSWVGVTDKKTEGYFSDRDGQLNVIMIRLAQPWLITDRTIFLMATQLAPGIGSV